MKKVSLFFPTEACAPPSRLLFPEGEARGKQVEGEVEQPPEGKKRGTF